MPVSDAQGGMPPEFVFFFPYRPISGVPMLFARIARELHARGHRCTVIDYPDGCLAQKVADVPGITRVPFADGVPVSTAENALIVMQAMLPATMWEELQPPASARVLFWSLYAMNYVQFAAPLDWARHWQTRSMRVQRWLNRTVLSGFQRSLRAFVAALVDRGSLVFMDGSTWRAAADRLEVALPRPAFVPVVVDVPEVNPRTMAPAGPFTATWLGRLDDFKIHILNHVIRMLDALASERQTPIELAVIGDGPLADRLASASGRWLTIRRCGTQAGAALAAELSRSHLHFAMGTSALEGARLGVPTVLVDFAYGTVPDDYEFHLLTEAVDYELGRQIDESLRGESSIATLRRIVTAVEEDGLRQSAAAYDYCRLHHSLEAGVSAFVAAAVRATYRYSEIGPDVRRKGWVRRAYERLRGRTPAAAAVAR